MRLRPLIPCVLLVTAACGGEDATGPEPARCVLSQQAFGFGDYVVPLADQDPLQFSGTVEISNEPRNRTGAGADALPVSLGTEMLTTLPVPPEVSFNSPQTELTIPPDGKAEITFNVRVTPATSPGRHMGRITFGSGCDAVTFTLELQGRPLAPPQYVGSIGSFGNQLGEFDSPECLAFGDDGRAYVVDTGNDRVQVFDADWSPLFALHEVDGAQDLSNPRGVAVRDGVIAVGDRIANGRIVLYDLDGNTIRAFGSGRPEPQFTDLQRVGLDEAGLIYASDGVGKRVEVFRLTGDPEGLGWEKVRQWGGVGGDAPGQIHFALGLLVVGDEVWLSDSGGARVNRFSLTGEFRSRIGEFGTFGGQFRTPRGFALTPQGNVVVVDAGNLRIQMVSASGEFLTSWGATKGPAVMESPRDVAVDASGDIYVVDGIGANRILRFRFP